MRSEWNGIGLMSGTSLDGIDLAWCRFSRKTSEWQYTIVKATTVPYPDEMRMRLATATEMSAFEYARLNNDLGELFADSINNWLGGGERPDFIASHGHTIFHQPNIGLTTQIGNGAVIAAKTKLPVVCDFRTKDVALHGQGAPLVPIGDETLFAQYDACLNLGGFANISFRNDDQRVAFDVSPCNMALNYLANKLNLPFDKDGQLARKGTVDQELLQKLNNIQFYSQNPPKSLGKEWFETIFRPLLDDSSKKNSTEDLIRTVLEHICTQIVNIIPEKCISMLTTGGGAKNRFLIKRMQEMAVNTRIVVPDELVIDYKEALIFAFLGLLRIEKHNNTLRSVTGADEDSCGGCIYL